jgi:hypothetical protein
VLASAHCHNNILKTGCSENQNSLETLTTGC